jgi:hypothetical protein
MTDVEGGIWTFLGMSTESSSFLFEHNDIELRQYTWYAGIEIWDLTSVKSSFVVTHNRIHSEDADAPFGAVFTSGVHDAVFANNIITGRGPAAFYLGLSDFDVGLTLVGNNVENWDVAPYGYWPELAPIFLGWLTEDCVVVGGHNDENVLDFGANNLVVGVNNMGNTELGQEVRDAMLQRIELKKNSMIVD